MTSGRLRLLSLLLAAVSALGLARPATAADSLRPEVGKPLQAATQLIQQQKYKEALAKVAEADAVPKKTPYETFIIERMRGAAATGAGEADVAANAFDSVIASGRLTPQENLQIMQSVAGMLYRAKEYGKVVTWAERYEKAGGTNPDMQTLIAQSYYVSGDYANAAKQMQVMIEATIKSGKAPSENDLQLLGSCYLKQHDQAGYTRSLEQLVNYYPKAEYWSDLLNQVQRKPGFSERLSLDVFRLKLATGTLTSEGDYMEMAQLAMQAGFPLEAQQVIDKGYAGKVLGTGQQAAREQRLKDMANHQVTEDRKTLGSDIDLAIKRGGEVLVATGYNLVLNGKVDQGIDLIKKAIAKGGLKYPGDAYLHLGEAYLYAGKTADANKALRSVQGSDGVADLARLWIIHSRAS